MTKRQITIPRRTLLGLALGTAGTALLGCTVTSPPESQASNTTPQTDQTKRTQINADVDAALARLYQQAPSSRDLVQRSRGVLVFPSVFKAGFVVGGEYGEGALRVGGRTVDYYSATAGSIGLQAGAQEKSVYILFMTDDALNKFRNSSGWQVGADASVAVINVGASGSVSSETMQQPVIGYVLTRGGLMVDASLAGTKVSKLQI